MEAINWIFKFIGLIFLTAFQVLVLNNLEVSIYIHPYVYPMFILILPLSTPRSIYLILAFASGLLIDMFINTPGMHAATCVFIAFIRPLILKILTPATGYENVRSPTIKYLGAAWFFIYIVIMILLHHVIYFFIEIFSLNNISYTLLKILLSGIFSVILILILSFLFTPRKQQR